jgi:hypothetical protein
MYNLGYHDLCESSAQLNEMDLLMVPDLKRIVID